MQPSRLSIAIMIPVCCALTGCVSKTPPTVGVGGEGFVSIPPRGGPSPLGGVLDPSSLTDVLANCVEPGQLRYASAGSASHNYSISGDAGIRATFQSLFGISLEGTAAKSVTVSAHNIQVETMVAPYRSIDTMGRCNLSGIKNPRYVRVAHKAASLTYTINEQERSGAKIDLCKSIKQINASASGRDKSGSY